jgi:hypothetical protein
MTTATRGEVQKQRLEKKGATLPLGTTTAGRVSKLAWHAIVTERAFRIGRYIALVGVREARHKAVGGGADRHCLTVDGALPHLTSETFVVARYQRIGVVHRCAVYGEPTRRANRCLHRKKTKIFYFGASHQTLKTTKQTFLLSSNLNNVNRLSTLNA